MTNFFEKLKKGMGAEVSQKEPEKKKEKVKKTKNKETSPAEQIKKLDIETKLLDIKIDEQIKEPKKVVEKEKKAEVKMTKKEETLPAQDLTEKEKWFEDEGQLAVDVYQTDSELVIQSAIAGVKPENLDILIEGDVITIKGRRKRPFEEEGDYFTQECYWGAFSRQLISPVEIDPSRVKASLKEGVLTIRMPKIQRDKKRKINVNE
jgi:HSP20 family protein